MYKNYIFLFKAILELQPLLTKSFLTEAYTQEKDKLFCTIRKPNGLEFSLVISADSNNPFILLKDSHHKAKKNTISFFNSYLPHEILDVKIALFDRIVKLGSSFGNLYVQFKGADSNIYFIDKDNSLSSFKKMSEQETIQVKENLSQTHFIDSFSELEKNLNELEKAVNLKLLPFIGKDIINFLENNMQPNVVNLITFYKLVIGNAVKVYYDELKGKAVFQPVFYPSEPLYEVFESYFEALNYLFSLSYRENKIQILKTSLEKNICKEMERMSSKLNQLKLRVEQGSKDGLYRQYGDLLLSNLSKLSKGLNFIELSNPEDSFSIRIVLDPKKNATQNIDTYYDKARNERIEFIKSEELYSLSQNKYERLLILKKQIETAEDFITLSQIKNEIISGKDVKNSLDEKEKVPYRHYLIDSKYHVYVGKDSKNNDQLTTRFAKQNDYWFHARSVAGSHVVLRVDNSKEAIPKKILENTASIAAFFSKAKTSKVASVTFTLKKYVNKNQRHEPGQVSVMKENVLLVRPEIPKNAEFLND